jgi:hypothetical protein
MKDKQEYATPGQRAQALAAQYHRLREECSTRYRELSQIDEVHPDEEASLGELNDLRILARAIMNQAYRDAKNTSRPHQDQFVSSCYVILQAVGIQQGSLV